MVNVSVTDILKIYGNWIESKSFVSLVSQKLRVSERQAYRLIKREPNILKCPIPNSKAVIYGLPEFGPLPKEKLSKNEEIIEEIIEQIDIRPEWCGVKLSPKFCEEHGLPQFREVKHVLHRKV